MLAMNSSQSKQHQDLNYLVVGLGVSGFSVANYLLARGYRCRVQDTRDIPPFLKQLQGIYPHVEVKKQALDGNLIGCLGVCVEDARFVD